jgi:hypothetical protein
MLSPACCFVAVFSARVPNPTSERNSNLAQAAFTKILEIAGFKTSVLFDKSTEPQRKRQIRERHGGGRKGTEV